MYIYVINITDIYNTTQKRYSYKKNKHLMCTRDNLLFATTQNGFRFTITYTVIKKINSGLFKSLCQLL